MISVLAISVFILAFSLFAFYRSKKYSSSRGAGYDLAAPRAASLFGNPSPEDVAEMRRAERLKASEESAAALRARSAGGDLETLREAHASGDALLYKDVLETLTARASSSAEALGEVVSFIARHEGHEGLRGGRTLAEAVMRVWTSAPDEDVSTAEMLHAAALSDDAATYEKAVEAALQSWQENKLHKLSAPALRTLLESEFWVLAPEARASGAGFVLKQTLAGAGRRLQAAESAAPATRAEQ